MSDISKILKAVQDIQTSLAILPEIQTHLAKLADAVNAHIPATAHFVNDIPSSFVLPNVSDSEKSINDVKNQFSKNEKENEQGVSKKENQTSSAESADKVKKKLTLSERKKLRKLKKKQATAQLNPGEFSSNELDVKSTLEIQLPQVQEDQHSTKEVAPSRVTARPPPRGPMRFHVSYF
jgi:hypothetical protein